MGNGGRLGLTESIQRVSFRCVLAPLYMLNGFLTVCYAWNGQTGQISHAERSLKASGKSSPLRVKELERGSVKKEWWWGNERGGKK